MKRELNMSRVRQKLELISSLPEEKETATDGGKSLIDDFDCGKSSENNVFATANLLRRVR